MNFLPFSYHLSSQFNPLLMFRMIRFTEPVSLSASLPARIILAIIHWLSLTVLSTSLSPFFDPACTVCSRLLWRLGHDPDRAELYRLWLRSASHESRTGAIIPTSFKNLCFTWKHTKLNSDLREQVQRRTYWSLKFSVFCVRMPLFNRRLRAHSHWCCLVRFHR